MRNPHEVSLIGAALLGFLAMDARAAETIHNDQVSITVDQGRYAIRAAGQAEPFASGALRYQGVVKVVAANDEVFGAGQAITVMVADGAGEVFQVFPNLPFALHRSILVNKGTAATVLNKVPLMDADLELGGSNKQWVVLGTGGLKPLAKAGGSYAWLAVADPSSRAGVVGGWLTHERGSGVVFAKSDGDKTHLEARLEYGCLRIEPGKSVASESFIIGWFADARLGLEAWADAVAKRLSIKLPPMPIVYCTWYDNVHGRASNAKALAELSAFATKALKPYGLSCLQIDDGWQMGEPMGNGPKKNFSAHNPKGPYPNGMKATADTLKADGFTAGLWILPFGGTWNDPFFETHQDWFVKKADGKTFDTAWGGTCLDMTHPGARDFVKGEIRQAVHDWGYHYLKLDGLSTGAGVKPQYVNDAWKEDNLGDGVFHDPSKTNLDAFRDGLRMVRATAGEDTFILGCCAPQNMRSYAGVFGLVDAMRMGPDNGGNWKRWMTSANFGSRNYHLNGRIWWSDPDPIYVRDGIPLESARCIGSWNAIAGQMISLSDWLPTLPEERLDIIRRCIPGHGVTARPIDLFQTWPPQQWLVTDERAGRQRRDVLGLFNWSDQAESLSLPVAGLGLPKADEYIAYDFWGRSFLPPFKETIKVDVPGAACRILAVRPLLPHPFLLSTSRHVSQGILEVSKEMWNETTKTLTGTSPVVAGDDYELRVAAGAPAAGWTLEKAEVVAAAGAPAGLTIYGSGSNGNVVAVIKSTESREVRWSLRFSAGVKPSATSAVETPAPLRDVKRIVFLGDSITQAGDYVTDFACWLAANKIPIEVLNLGLASETATDLTPEENAGHLKSFGFGRPFVSERLERALAATRPDVLVACYGMNDGGSLPADASGDQRFADAVTRLRDTALKSGVKRVVVCTPPVRDSAEDGNLTRYSTWLLGQKAKGWEVVDIHGPMRQALDERRKLDASFKFSGDGVHPGRDGHWLMAREILSQWLGARLAEVPSAESLFGPNGKGERNRIQQQQRSAFTEWMTKIGHQRPGVPGGPDSPGK